MLKLLLGNPYALIGIGALILVLACGNVTFWALWDGASTKLEVVTKDRDAQAKAVKVGQGIVARQQAVMDEHDAQAVATIRRMQSDNLRLAAQNQAIADGRESILQQIKDRVHERTTVITVSGAPVPQGWDPVVLAGMRCLRGVQLGHDLSAPECRIQAADGAGGPGAAGDSAGAGAPRPDAGQQADFLAFAWRLRDWGASCYQDKRAISASQVAP